MKRSQAMVIGLLIGFVALVFIGMIILIAIPFERVFPPTPTPTSPPPTATATATLPSFLPTASLVTLTPPAPTPTNTRVPTATPRPPRAPTPTVVIKLTFPIRATEPVETSVALPTSTDTPTPTSTPLPPSRQYTVSFKAKDATITKGDCTDLEWKVEGASSVMLDGQGVAVSGKKEVCPKRDTSYQLTIQLPGSAQLINRTIKISVKEDE